MALGRKQKQQRKTVHLNHDGVRAALERLARRAQRERAVARGAVRAAVHRAREPLRARLRVPRVEMPRRTRNGDLKTSRKSSPHNNVELLRVPVRLARHVLEHQRAAVPPRRARSLRADRDRADGG